MKHHRNAVGFGSAVDDFQFLDSVEIVVRKQQLMRRGDLDHANAKPQNVLNISHDVGGMPGMEAAAGDQPLGIVFNIIAYKLVDLGGQADDLGCHVVNQDSAVNSAAAFPDASARASASTA